MSVSSSKASNVNNKVKHQQLKPELSIIKAITTKKGRNKLKDIIHSQAFQVRARGTTINLLGVFLGSLRNDPAMAYGASARGAVYGDRDVTWLKHSLNSEKDADLEPFDKTRFATDSSGFNSLILSNVSGIVVSSLVMKTGLPLAIAKKMHSSNPEKDTAYYANLLSILPCISIGGVMGTMLNRLYIDPVTNKSELKQLARLTTLEYLRNIDAKNISDTIEKDISIKLGKKMCKSDILKKDAIISKIITQHTKEGHNDIENDFLKNHAVKDRVVHLVNMLTKKIIRPILKKHTKK